MVHGWVIPVNLTPNSCKMKKGKATDLDNITAKHLQFCKAMLPCVLVKLFNLCISVGPVPGISISLII